MTTLQDKILTLRSKGMTYPEIQAVLGCSKSTISYYLSEGGKNRVAERTKKRRAADSLLRKTEAFQVAEATPVRTAKSSRSKREQNMLQSFQATQEGTKITRTDVKRSAYTFTTQDVRDKFGETPSCYLTGEALDYNDIDSLSFDHIVPRSRGGSNKIENLGLSTKLANRMKSDMTVEELLDMCEKILRHHGRM